MATAACAQSGFNLFRSENVAVNFNSEEVPQMPFNNGGKTLTVMGYEFDLTEYTHMTTGDVTVAANEVAVVYDGSKATVYLAPNIQSYITAEFDGAHVTLTQSKDVGDDTGEIIYILKGKSSNGSFTLDGKYKATIELQGLTLTNPSGAAIDIQNGKRIELSAKSGTENTLTDGSGDQKAALYCKGHLEFKGKGVLNVTGTVGHAVAAKEYIEMKNLTLNILGAPKDAINCTQHFTMESGTLNVSGVEGDGVQVDFDDPTSGDEEDTGSITIEDGTINMTLAGTAAKGLKAEGNLLVKKGDITITNTGIGEWSGSKTKAAACIGIDGTVTINGGTFELTATGGGGKGITCEGELEINGGEFNVTTSGGVLAYVNGVLNQNYTGSTDRLDSDAKSSPKGIKCDSKVTINGGDIYVKTTGNNGEGIESKDELTVNNGNITIRAKDDAINASNDLIINGGNIDVIATNNDGLDANGNIRINGGVIRAFGGSSPECGIDANDERGYTVIITGGYLLAVGGGNSVPNSSSGSEQPYVTTSGSITGGTAISISNGTTELYSFTVPEDYTKPSGGNTGGWGPGGGNGGNMQIMISVPGMANNTSYTIKNGTTTSTATSRLTGTSSGPGGRW